MLGSVENLPRETVDVDFHEYGVLSTVDVAKTLYPNAPGRIVFRLDDVVSCTPTNRKANVAGCVAQGRLMHSDLVPEIIEFNIPAEKACGFRGGFEAYGLSAAYARSEQRVTANAGADINEAI